MKNNEKNICKQAFDELSKEGYFKDLTVKINRLKPLKSACKRAGFLTKAKPTGRQKQKIKNVHRKVMNRRTEQQQTAAKL